MSKLLYPYTYEERTPTFKEGVLFIPEFFKDEDFKKHQKFQDANWNDLFSHPHIAVEFCSGSGAWICEMAKKFPNKLFLACEIRYDRVKKIYKKIQVEGIQNLIIGFGYAEDFAKYYLKQNSIKEVFVNFPDPWPKKRHAKNRLFQEAFINDLKNALSPGSSVTLATDDLPYMEESTNNLIACGFTPEFKQPFYQPLDQDYGFSFFQDLWISKGKTNYKTILKKP